MAIDQSVFQGQGIAGGPATYITKNKAGELAEIQIERDQWKAPADGRHLVVLKAMSTPYEHTGQYGTQRKVRCVFVVKAPGTINHGCMFSQPVAIAKLAGGTWRGNITNKSAAGQMIACIRGKEIAEGEPINMLDYLNGELSVSVTQQTGTNAQGLVEVYANIVKDSWRPADQHPQPVAAGSGAPAVNPFLDED